MSIARRFLASSLLALASAGAAAVSLNPEGLGQALVYPYYTVRSAQGNPFNTYISVVNHGDDAKALRVRFREGRNAREVLSFNLYLSPYDVWTAAVVPTDQGARLVTADHSCTDPVMPSTGMAFSAALFRGANDDGNGTAVDRTREGFLEILEMATLTGASAAAVTQSSNAIPENCPAIRTGAPSIAAPTGGLSGTLTLINVASGLDFTVNADALEQLTTQPFFRPAADPYPDFAAQEVTPVSIVMHEGRAYRSLWTRGVDAVSAVFMRSAFSGEYVLDAATASRTDLVVTLPTRHHYTGGLQPPFTSRVAWAPRCEAVGEPLDTVSWNRDTRTDEPGCGVGICPPLPWSHALCASASVASVVSGARNLYDPTELLGSTTGGLNGGTILVTAGAANGWLKLSTSATTTVFASMPSSVRIGPDGAVLAAPHQYRGLPVTGFAMRLFSNGTLQCATGACQGNYGGAFPLIYERNISP